MIGEILEHAVAIGAMTSPVLGVFVFEKVKVKNRKKRHAAAIEAEKVCGLDKWEWYEIIKNLSREDYERLSLAPLDGLERSNLGWDVKALIGSELWNTLHRKWYPELYCKHCNSEGCKGGCWQAQEKKQLAKSYNEKKSDVKYSYEYEPNSDTVRVVAAKGSVTASIRVYADQFEDKRAAVQSYLLKQINDKIESKKMAESSKYIDEKINLHRRAISNYPQYNTYNKTYRKSDYELEW